MSIVREKLEETSFRNARIATGNEHGERYGNFKKVRRKFKY